MKINIPEPCDADWNKMKIGVRSRHCSLCTKDVVDFTEMSKSEIVEYFLNKEKSERTCGHFKKNQLDFTVSDLKVIIEEAKTKKGNIAFAILAAASLSLASCSGQAGYNEDMIGKVASSHDTLQSIRIDADMIDFSANDTLSSSDNLGLTPYSISTNKTGEISMNPVDSITKECDSDQKYLNLSGEPQYLDGEVEVIATQGMVALEESVSAFAEVMPEFPGGINSLTTYLEKDVNYPKKDKKAGNHGTVIVSFVVEIDGSLSDIKILKAIPNQIEINIEVIRVIENMPKWIPGSDKGLLTRVQMTLPISFKL